MTNCRFMAATLSARDALVELSGKPGALGDQARSILSDVGDSEARSAELVDPAEPQQG